MITCNLRSLIGLKGIGSQNRLSERTGISAKQLSRLANNKQQQISFHNIERLCTVLECSLDELFGNVLEATGRHELRPVDEGRHDPPDAESQSHVGAR